MSTSLTVERKRLTIHRWPPRKGPLITLVVALISEVMSRTLLDIPLVAPLFLPIVYTAFREGREAGLISAGITVLYALYIFAIPGQPLHYTFNGMIRVAVVVGTAPGLAVLVGMFKNRVEREYTEALRMQDYQNLLLQSVNDAIIATDIDLQIQIWNPASEMIYGWQAAQVQGKAIDEVIPILRYGDGSSREQALAMLKEQAHWSGRVVQRHRDGHELQIETAMRAIYDADRRVIGYVSVNRDITEQQHARAERERLHQQLESERARFEAVLCQMPAGVAIAEAPSGKLVLGNEQLARILRYPFFPAANIAEYDRYRGFHHDRRPYQAEEWPLARSILTGEVVVDEEIDVLRGDGTTGTICVSSTPIRDRHGNITAAVSTFYDVTERRRGEEHQRFLAQAGSILADSLDYESTIASVVHLAIPHLADWCIVHLLGEDGTLQRPAVAHVNSDLEGLIREIQRRRPIDDDPESPIMEVLHSGRAQMVSEVSDDQLRYVSYDEEHYQALQRLGFKSYMIVPLLAHGRTLGAATFVSANHCYTDDDLAQAAELMRRCALAVDNARLYREAQQAVRTRNELILIVSHDLKNPLSAIKGYANFLQRRGGRDLPGVDWLEDGLSKIDATTKKMTGLLNELLDFARLQEGQTIDLDLLPTDLVALVRQTVAEYQQATDHHQISVVADVPSLVGLYDTSRLERVLANLLSNAIKYSPDGGEITVEVTQVAAPEAHVLINVRDHGLGIPANDLPHIFEPFHRAHNVVGRVRGTGIGLTSAKQIVEQHGGTLTVQSAEGSGSTFTIRLPLTTVTPDDQPL
ncbi:MAG TPA: ATP-binding protein [Herpetosiphonaceae bacterium]